MKFHPCHLESLRQYIISELTIIMRCELFASLNQKSSIFPDINICMLKQPGDMLKQVPIKLKKACRPSESQHARARNYKIFQVKRVQGSNHVLAPMMNMALRHIWTELNNQALCSPPVVMDYRITKTVSE